MRKWILIFSLFILTQSLYSQNLTDNFTRSRGGDFFQIQANPFHPGTKANEALSKREPSRFLQTITKWQKPIRLKLYKLIKKIKMGSLKALLIALLISFLYGIIHAAGPSHRKIIFFSYFSTHRSTLATQFGASYFSSLIHALSALMITAPIFYIVKRSTSIITTQTGTITEIITWFMLIAMGLALFVKQLIELILPLKENNEESKLSKYNLWILTLITSAVPCPAASIIILISLQQKIIFSGILMLIALALGMGTTLSMVTLGARFSHISITALSKRKGKKYTFWLEWCLESFGSLLIIAIGLVMVIPML